MDEHEAVVTHALPLRQGTSSGASVEVPHDGFEQVFPGEYGSVLVRSRATLELAEPGLYRFSSLVFEPDGLLNIAGDQTEVALAIDGDLVLGDRFTMAAGNQSTQSSRHLFLYAAGQYVEYGHDSVVIGDLEAPAAHVEIRDRSFVRGTIGGRTVTIGHDATVGPRAPFALPE